MEEILDKRKFVLATVDRIEKEKAVFKLDDGQSLDWPVAKLPTDVAEGSRLKLILSSDKTEEKEREELAKTVLNEILKTE
jgi:hypothetical protein